jgi:hypothetical protein
MLLRERDQHDATPMQFDEVSRRIIVIVGIFNSGKRILHRLPGNLNAVLCCISAR